MLHMCFSIRCIFLLCIKFAFKLILLGLVVALWLYKERSIYFRTDE